MTWTTDNRWPVAGDIPDNALAAYGARWIDDGDWADVVPDRQGFAYNDDAHRDQLINLLNDNDAQHLAVTIAHGDTHTWQIGPLTLNVGRRGGYFYVTAWLTPEDTA